MNSIATVTMSLTNRLCIQQLTKCLRVPFRPLLATPSTYTKKTTNAPGMHCFFADFKRKHSQHNQINQCQSYPPRHE